MGGKKNAWQNPWEQKNAWDTTALVRRFYYSDTIYSCPNTITITLLLSRYFCSLSACVDKIPEMRKKVKTKKTCVASSVRCHSHVWDLSAVDLSKPPFFLPCLSDQKRHGGGKKKSRQPVAAVELSPTETCPGRPVKGQDIRIEPFATCYPGVWFTKFGFLKSMQPKYQLLLLPLS